MSESAVGFNVAATRQNACGLGGKKAPDSTGTASVIVVAGKDRVVRLSQVVASAGSVGNTVIMSVAQFINGYLGFGRPESRPPVQTDRSQRRERWVREGL